MPTIPRFHVTQDAAWVFVHVHVPYVRVSEMEFYVDGAHFTFFCKPYLLKLQFPHEVVDDELAKAVYDPNKENGTIVVHLPKKEPGQEFEDLDMLTKLLQPKEPKIDLALQKAKTPAPLIEVIESTDAADTDSSESSVTPVSTSASTNATLTHSTAPASTSLLDLESRITSDADSETVRITNLTPTYGFNGAYSDFFRVWHGEVSEILSLPDPEHTPADQRRVLREAAEDAQFDVERYLLDFINQDDDMYLHLAMDFEPFWHQFPVAPKKSPLVMEAVATSACSSSHDSSGDATASQINASLRSLTLSGDASLSGSPSSSPTPPTDVFSDEDRELLLRLPHKEFLVERGSAQEATLLGGLADILVGFTYDHITTQGDSGIESTWTASIVSPTLAWLDTTSDLAAVVRTAVRRILAFPFLRQFDLAMHVLRETAALLARGKRVVLRALLALYRVVEKSETQYLLNALYVQDYCVWIQSVDDAALVRLSEQLARHVAAFRKVDTGWALDEMERRLLEADDDDNDDDVDGGQGVSEEVESSSEDGSSSSEEDDDRSSDDDEEDATAAKHV